MAKIHILKRFVLVSETFNSIDKLKDVPRDNIKEFKVISGIYYGNQYIVTYKKPLCDFE